MDSLHHLKFELAGLSVDLCTFSSPVASFLADYFRFYPTDQNSGKADISITVDAYTPESFALPGELELISRTGVVGFFKAPDNTYYLQTDITCFRISPEAGTAKGWFLPKALEFPHLLVNTYIYAVLVLLLRARSVYHLHAAAVLSPEGEISLIAGPQRSGKSTLTAAFAASGWKTISDDGLLLSNSPDPACSAYLRDFHLANKLVSNWDFLKRAEVRYTYLDRSCIDGLKLTGSFEAARQSYSKVSKVLFPVVSPASSSHLEALDPGDAMLYLIEQSMFFALWQNSANEQLQILASLLKHARFYKFHSGKDLWSNPETAAKLLSN